MTWVLFFDTRCGIVARRGMASFKAKFPVLQELFAKNHRPPPPAGRGLKVTELWHTYNSSKIVTFQVISGLTMIFTP